MKSVAILLALLPLAVSAATITVNTTADNITAGDGRCTLREAIANMNAAADTTGGDCNPGSGAGDTIKFGFAVPAKIRLALGELVIQRDVNITNLAPGVLRIDAAGKARVFQISAGTTSMVHLSIEHGSADTGGDIIVDNGATLALFDCVIARGSATSGGGIMVNQGATATLVNCVIARNTAKGPDSPFPLTYGGGIYNAGTLALNGCMLMGNKAANFGFGGAISNIGGLMTLVDCRLVGNRAYDGGGGGLYNESGTVTLESCSFTANRSLSVSPDNLAADAFGGGIYNAGAMTLAGGTLNRNVAASPDYSDGGGIHNEGSMVLTSCTLAGNASLARSNLSGTTGSFGGGIDNWGAMALTNCTLVGNTAKANTAFETYAIGGGICVEETGSLTLTNCTLSGNTAHRRRNGDAVSGGGNLMIFGGAARLTNTIVTNGGVAGNCSLDPYGGILTTGGHNLSSDDGCFAAGGSDRLDTKARLAPLGNYGGPTQTMALCTAAGIPPGCHGASPAINAGDDTVTGPPDNLSTDQRGLPRLSGAHVDIGAYEVQ